MSTPPDNFPRPIPPGFPPQAHSQIHATPLHYQLPENDSERLTRVLRRWVYIIGLILCVPKMLQSAGEFSRAIDQLDRSSSFPATQITVWDDPPAQLLMAFSGAAGACMAIIMVGCVLGLAGVRSARLWVLFPAAVSALVSLVATVYFYFGQWSAMTWGNQMEKVSMIGMYTYMALVDMVYPAFCIAILGRKT